VGIAKSIHPFPARMAPEIALRAVSDLGAGSVVLDPMAGSGTVLRAATEAGHFAIGYDLDPLAVLMAKVWNTPVDTDAVLRMGFALLDRCAAMDKRKKVSLPWIDNDEPTHRFINEWFYAPQRNDLRRLSCGLRRLNGSASDALRICFSRIIIRKEGGASRANDVSHSRPHRRKEQYNEFDVLRGFEIALKRVVSILSEQPPKGGAIVRLGDGRKLSDIKARSVDGIITSPPYLNAIDYLRGHKLTLVWLGYQIATLTRIRAACVGAERAGEAGNEQLIKRVVARVENMPQLPRPQQRMLDRYILDLYAALRAAHRVLKDDGRAVFVVGNSCLRGVFIRNSDVLQAVASHVGLDIISCAERELAPSRRYLPPPGGTSERRLEARMRTEVIMTFTKRQSGQKQARTCLGY
jgi:DNA modification methylase